MFDRDEISTTSTPPPLWKKTEIIAMNDLTDTGKCIAFDFTFLFRQKLATVCFVLCYRYALFADYESYISCQDRVSELYKVRK